MSKLSPSAISTFLKSPKAYYWRYVARLEPVTQSTVTFDDAKVFGSIWAAYVDRFYKGTTETDNIQGAIKDWTEGTDGWVPEKKQLAMQKGLEALGAAYYQTFDPKDGMREKGSELVLENDRFYGILDGLSAENVVHEVKTTSRSPMLSEQLWRVQNSIQAKVYVVLAQADGICIEFGFKDSPTSLFRGPIMAVSSAQREQWEAELNNLANMITGLGDDPDNYPCHPDGCCIVTKGYAAMCGYQTLCEQGITDVTKLLYKPKANRK